MDGLSAFDTTTMTYLATQMAQPNGGDNGGDMLLPLELQDYQSTFGYAGSEELNPRSLQPPPSPPIKRFPSTYDDPFSDVISQFGAANNEQNEQETPSIDRDNKLLSFSLPSLDFPLLDWTNRQTTISLTAQLHGMFFLAESPWAAAGDAQAPPPSELTCYRRNLFQITGDVTLPRTLRSLLTEQGEQIPIVGHELMLSATESTEGNSVKIISVPWKTPANTGMPVAEDKAEREPPSIPLDLMNVQEVGTGFATFPFQWKRLQFRIATANNGRRKELQQHFVVHLRVIATLATGGQIPICEVHSGAIIVRGRSPRNFQARKDLPLSGSGNPKRAAQVPGSQPGLLSRSVTGDSTHKPKPEEHTSTPLKQHSPSTQPVVEQGEAHVNNDFYEWKGVAQAQGGATEAVPPPTSALDGDKVYAISLPGLTRQAPKSAVQPAAPISLSLVEDESPGLGARTTPEQRAKRIHIPPRAPSYPLTTVDSPDESADLLYEYFPLGLDDWMPPVDAVYRPHVVHHTKLPSDPRDPKASGRSARSKRLYSANDMI